MTDEKVPLESCPREDCDEPIIEAFRTDRAFQLQRQNMIVDKWCVIPRNDPGTGEAWVYVIRHGEVVGFKTGSEVRKEEVTAADDDEEEDTTGELEGDTTTDELKESTADEDDDVETVEAEAESEDDDDSPDTDELSEFQKRIVRYVDKRDGSKKLAEVQGKFSHAERTPNEVKAAVSDLVARGYLTEIDDAVYVVD